jgi:outer membrane protein assembly factor BamB
VDVDRVVCTPGGPQGTVAAFNKVNGDLLWQSKEITDDAAYSSLVIAHFGGKRQYVQLTAASVFGVAADTGKLLWRAPRSGRTAVIPTPILHEDLVYVTSGYGVGCNLFRVTAEGEAFRAEEVYNNKVMVNHHGGVVKVGEHLYGFSDGKGWTCQELKTGRDVWQEKEQLGKGAIGYADGRLYLRAESGPGTVVLIEATPDGFREKGRFNQPERSGKNSWPHPIIANSRLYLRDQDLLLCYDVREK